MPSQKPNKKNIPNPRNYFSIANLRHIWRNAPVPDKKASGVDKVTPKKFKDNLEVNFEAISKKLFDGTYKFRELRAKFIPKGDGKDRTICIPTMRDRLVQRLLLYFLTDPSDKLNITNEVSFDGRGQGVHTAISKALKFRNKYPYVLKTDITAFFDRVDRLELIKLIEYRLKKRNPTFIPLLKQVVKCDVLIENNYIEKTLERNGIALGRGLRQGMPLSPLLASLFLSPLDKLAEKQDLNMIRYVDDIAIFSNSEEECFSKMELIESVLKKIQLTVPSLKAVNSKTQIKKPNEPVIFLGFEIYKCNNGLFEIRVPDSSIHEILNELNEYSNYQYFSSKKLNYAALVRELNNKRTGYRASYKEATNVENFLLQVDAKIEEVKHKLLDEVLGAGFCTSLSEEQKSFLGI